MDACWVAHYHTFVFIHIAKDAIIIWFSDDDDTGARLLPMHLQYISVMHMPAIVQAKPWVVPVACPGN